MPPRWFGTDGIRGAFGAPPITPEQILKLGWATGRVLVEENSGAEPCRVLIGKDTRVSGYLLESALESGFSAAGVHIDLVGPLPTPAIAYLTQAAEASAGVVISASHNPYTDNGIKLFSHAGTKLEDRLLIAIEDMMEQPLVCAPARALGKASRMADAAERYLDFCKRCFPNPLSLKSLRIVVDCANGAAYEVAPKLLHDLGAEVIPIAAEPDGFNINENCGSTCLATLTEAVQTHQAHLGAALDGDADRVLLADANGNCVDGDQILYLIARHRQATGRLAGGVAGTVLSNLGLEQGLGELGIEFERTQVGDRHIYRRLMEKNWQLGGETSGHTLCLDKSNAGDGLLTLLEVLQVILETGDSLDTLAARMPVYPQIMRNVLVPPRSGAGLAQDPMVTRCVERIERQLGDSGRVILRPSGTEPLVRVMVEGTDEEQVDAYSREIADVVAERAADSG